MEYKFRELRADEIEIRVGTISDKGITLLLYKDARCDQNILDETVGSMNWQKHYSRDNANCIISIWDSEKKQWVEKEDVGVESYAEKEKGLASDSQKRSGFAWGIGRELYTSPFIWIKSDACNIQVNSKGKKECKDNFVVTKINYDDSRRIIELAIRNESFKKDVFYWKKNSKVSQNPSKVSQSPPEEIRKLSKNEVYELRKLIVVAEQDEKAVLKKYKVDKLEDLSLQNFTKIYEKLKKFIEKEKK